MGGSAHLSYAVGGRFTVGGVMGYVKARSVPSLIGGCGMGAAMLASVRMRSPPPSPLSSRSVDCVTRQTHRPFPQGALITKGDDKEGHGLALATSGLAVAAMGRRVLSAPGNKAIPGGVAAVGLVSSAYHAKKLSDWW